MTNWRECFACHAAWTLVDLTDLSFFLVLNKEIVSASEAAAILHPPPLCEVVFTLSSSSMAFAFDLAHQPLSSASSSSSLVVPEIQKTTLWYVLLIAFKWGKSLITRSSFIVLFQDGRTRTLDG